MKVMDLFKPEARFISVSVYKFPLGNCGGITDTARTIYIPSESGPHKYKDLDPSLVFYKEKRSEEYWCLNPIIERPGMIGPSSGGNLAYSSDSRCERVYHIHDRWETPEEYEALSN